VAGHSAVLTRRKAPPQACVIREIREIRGQFLENRMRHEVTTRRVLYEISGMQSIQPRKAEFLGANREPLAMEIYDAIGPIAGPPPMVVILEGYPDPGFEQKLGCKFMDMEWTMSIARLIAASGMTAITHTNRDPEPDALALIDHLSAKARKVGIWATSGHGPVALVAAKKAACAVLTNPITKDFCPDTPLFVVRSGKDETHGLNTALDAFAARAIAENRPMTLVNYPDAPHSFELAMDGPETGRILRQGLDFLRGHLM